MKTEFENNSLDLEQLLRTKSWEQLSEVEQNKIREILSGRDEYMRMYATTNQLMSGSGVHEDELKPSAQVRENLMSAFDKEQRKRRAAWWSSLWYGLSDKMRFDIPIVRIAVATVLLLAGVFGVAKLMEKNDGPQVVKSEPRAPADEVAPKNLVPNDDIVEQPSDNGTVPIPEQSSNRDSQIVAVQPQIAVVNPIGTQNNVIQDSTPQYITAFTNNGQPLIVDSNMFVLPTATFNAPNVFCAGTSNGTVVATGGSNYTYQWTPTATATVIGLPARSRSLENDAAVLDVFFAVK